MVGGYEIQDTTNVSLPVIWYYRLTDDTEMSNISTSIKTDLHMYSARRQPVMDS